MKHEKIIKLGKTLAHASERLTNNTNNEFTHNSQVEAQIRPTPESSDWQGTGSLPLAPILSYLRQNSGDTNTGNNAQTPSTHLRGNYCQGLRYYYARLCTCDVDGTAIRKLMRK